MYHSHIIYVCACACVHVSGNVFKNTMKGRCGILQKGKTARVGERDEMIIQGKEKVVCHS